MGIISGTGVVTRPTTTTSVSLVATITKGVASDAQIFTVTVLLGAVLTDSEAVAADWAALAITYSGGDTATGVTGNLTLPTSGANGTTISWISSNESLVSTIGVVTRPSAPTTVYLTATISKGSKSDNMTFQLNILQATLTDAQAVAADKSGLQIVFASGDTAVAVTATLTLATSGANGTAISWSSDNTAVVSATGVVSRPAETTTVTLTAAIIRGSVSATKTFSVTVLQAMLTTPRLLPRTRAPSRLSSRPGTRPVELRRTSLFRRAGRTGPQLAGPRATRQC